MLFVVNNADAQKIYATRNGKISFSAPSDDDVKAVNNEVTSRIADNGQITFSLLIKGFKFKLAEMQEHFNDQYLESNKFPRADFKGNIVNVSDVNFSKDGSYKVSVKGDLTLHGVTKPVSMNLWYRGTSTNPQNNKMTSGFQLTGTIKRSDFNIGAKFPAAMLTDEVAIKADGEFNKQ